MYLELVYKVHLLFNNKAKAKTIANQLLFGLVRYINSNYANNLENKKLIIRYYFLIYDVIVF